MGRRAWRIGLRAILALSLLLNAVALAALLRVAELRDLAGFRDAGLPREVRRAFMEAAEEDEALLGAMRELGEARRSLIAAGTARPSDPEALDAALAEMRARSAAAQLAAHALLREALLGPR